MQETRFNLKSQRKKKEMSQSVLKGLFYYLVMIMFHNREIYDA